MTTCGCTWQRRVWGWLQYSPSQFDLEPSQGGREYKNISMNIRISMHIKLPGLDFQVQKLTAKMAHSHKMTLAFGSTPSMSVPFKRFACCYRLPSMKSFLKLHKFEYVTRDIRNPLLLRVAWWGILKFALNIQSFQSWQYLGLDMALWFLICYHHSASTNHIKRLWSHLFGRAHAHLLSTDLGCTLFFINAQTLRRFRRLKKTW